MESEETNAHTESTPLVDPPAAVSKKSVNPDVSTKAINKPHERDKVCIMLGYFVFNIATVLILFALSSPWLIFTQPDTDWTTGDIVETYGFFQTCTGHMSSRGGTPELVSCSPFPTLASCGSRFPQIGWFTCSQIRIIRLSLSIALAPLLVAFVLFGVQSLLFSHDRTRVREELRILTRGCLLMAVGFVGLGLVYTGLYSSYLSEKKKVRADGEEVLMRSVQEWSMGRGWQLASSGVLFLLAVWFLLGFGQDENKKKEEEARTHVEIGGYEAV